MKKNVNLCVDLKTLLQEDTLLNPGQCYRGILTRTGASYNADVDIIYCSLFCGTDNALDDKKTLQAYATTRCTPLRLHMYPDADIPGERLYLELVRLAGELGASIQRHSLPPGLKDFGELWSRRNRNP